MNKTLCLLFANLLCFSPVTFSDVWAEREALARVASELTALERLVISAKRHSNTDDRTTFHYPALLNDLQKIRSGITHHLDAPMEPVLPETIDVLTLDYTEQQP